MDKLKEKSRARRRGSLLVVARRQVGPAMGRRWSGSRAVLCRPCVGSRLTGNVWRVRPPVAYSILTPLLFSKSSAAIFISAN